MLVQRIYADMQSGKTTTALALLHAYHSMGMRALYIGHRPEEIEFLSRRSGLPRRPSLVSVKCVAGLYRGVIVILYRRPAGNETGAR